MRLPAFLRAAILIPFALATPIALAELRAVRLTCEGLTNPPAIDVSPRLSWALESNERGQAQTAYQILVASDRETLEADRGNLWDSGQTKGADSLNVAYAGKPLTSGATVHWKVRVWDRAGQPSPWSEPASWEMGLLNPDDWKAKWICDPRPLPTDEREMYADRPSPLFRHGFSIDKPVRRARAYASGLGYYELRLNGQRVGDHQLDPAWTTYQRRVLYSTYDVTERLRQGRNAVGVWVGNGWYQPLPMRFWGWLNLREHLAMGAPRAIVQIDIAFEDGSRQLVKTDETWRFGESPIVRNNIYLGEVYDARRETPGWDTASFDDSVWKPVALSQEAVGPLRAQMVPPIRMVERIPAKAIAEPKPGVYVFDMGQNMGGTVTLRVRGEAGRRIQLRYGELLNKDGTLNPLTSVAGQIKKKGVGGPGAPDVAWQSDVYICKGDGEEVYTPRFTFHGFRYVEVSGLDPRPSLDMLTAHTMHTDVASAGSFSCSNEMLNRVQEMTRRTLMSNLFGVQSDCPARERFGYGGDIAVTSEMAMMNYDMRSFYAKTVRDYGDAAQPGGGLTETAPYVGIDGLEDGFGNGVGPIGWGTGHPLLVWQMYQYYGDRRLVEEQYPIAQKWTQYLDAKAKDLTIDVGIGDHETLAPKVVPLTSTAFYWYNHELLSRLARILDRQADAERHRAKAEDIRASFNRHFLDAKTGRCGNGSQACQAFALHFGLAPADQRDAVLRNLLDDVRKHGGHLTTGIFGTPYMLTSLSDLGHAETAYEIVNQRSFPGWGHMLANGATTLWEHWELSDNVYSHNHPMFGSVSAWFFQRLAGIAPAPDAVGFDRIVLQPGFVKDLTEVKGRYESPRGPIVSEWAGRDEVRWHVSIPPGTTARVQVRCRSMAEVNEDGAILCELKSPAGTRNVFEMPLESGEYWFKVVR